MNIIEQLEKEEIARAIHEKQTAKESSKPGFMRGTTELPRLEVLAKPSRYISARIRQLLTKEHGTQCSIQTCENEATQTHHEQRLALSRNHDPHYLAPLCTDHHKSAHSIDVKFQEIRQATMR